MTNMIYILALEDNCFYVGRTENLQKRIRDHFSGRGAAWTKVHKPIGVVKTIRCRLNEEEDMWTKKMMGQYSVAQVRGGSHCQVTLDEDQKKYLERERRHNSNSCFICSKEGHYAKQCKKKLEFKELKFKKKPLQPNTTSRKARPQTSAARRAQSVPKRVQKRQSRDWDSDSYYDSEDCWEIESDDFNERMAELHLNQSQGSQSFGSSSLSESGKLDDDSGSGFQDDQGSQFEGEACEFDSGDDDF